VYCVSRYLVIILYCPCISNTCRKKIPHTLISCFFFNIWGQGEERQTDNSHLAASRCCCLRGFFPFSASFCQYASPLTTSQRYAPLFCDTLCLIRGRPYQRVYVWYLDVKHSTPIIFPEPVGHPSSGSRPKSPLWVSSFFSVGIVIWTRYLHTGQMARQEFLL